MRAVVLAVNLNSSPEFDNQCEETSVLAQAAGYEVVEIMRVPRRHPDRKTFIGKGKLEELKSCLSFHDAGTIVVNHTLSDGQHARLGEGASAELLDYSGLILTIFANRAKTAEGKLQVELAQEIYGRSKLKGTWTHLERQRGALGATGGPGERQLELDRRMVAKKINQLRKRLDKRAKHTRLVTQNRRKNTRTVALVGYTNAGKSTLFSNLTGVKVSASSRLFETLDTTSRRLYLDADHHVVLSDTVGFIRNLPHELIDAFRSTLQEALTADLVLIIVDASDPDVQAKLDTIFTTLKAIGSDDLPCFLVFSKVDLGRSQMNRTDLRWDKIINLVEVSALTGSGIQQLRGLLLDYFHLASAKQA